MLSWPGDPTYKTSNLALSYHHLTLCYPQNVEEEAEAEKILTNLLLKAMRKQA